MPTTTEVQTNILNAQQVVANLVNTNYTKLSGGNLNVNWSLINKYTRAINCVSRQYKLGDISSTNFITVYNFMVNFIGNTLSAPINSNAQASGFTIAIVPTIITKSQSNLVDAGGGNWYLPYLDNNSNILPSGIVPYSVTTNGVSFNFTYDTTTIPSRIYGFANNLTQTIIVNAL